MTSPSGCAGARLHPRLTITPGQTKTILDRLAEQARIIRLLSAR